VELNVSISINEEVDKKNQPEKTRDENVVQVSYRLDGAEPHSTVRRSGLRVDFCVLFQYIGTAWDAGKEANEQRNERVEGWR
jgi:hypothetical protein